MTPSVLTSQIRRAVEDFLQTAFPPWIRFFHGLLDRLIAKEGGLFRGPYLPAPDSRPRASCSWETCPA